jgi:hypothetical protein
MLFFHLKSFVFTLFYLFLSFLFIFFINFSYLDIFIHFAFEKCFSLSPLYAIHFYEILFSKFSLTFFLSLLIFLPIFPLFLVNFFISGLFIYELMEFGSIWGRLSMLYVLDIIILWKIILPILFLNIIPSSSILQIYSFGNITSLFIKIIVIWLIGSNTVAKLTERSYIPIIIILMSIFIIPPDVKIQILMIGAATVYMEIKIFGAILARNHRGGSTPH